MRLLVDDLRQVQSAETLDFGMLSVRAFTGVSTDSRKVRRGEIFVALSGTRFDGHSYVLEAFSRGAACAVVEHKRYREEWRGRPVLVVPDSVRALGGIAALHRKKFDIPVLAIAGSNGKTTTKEMIASVLGTRYTVLHTRGNLNNHIGVPMTLFRLERRHEIAVIEIGTNHFGELEYLCSLLRPTHGLITNIGKEHLEHFGNLAGVARAEGELFNALSSRGTGFVNADDPGVVRLGRSLRRKVTYGFHASRASVRGSYGTTDHKGRIECIIQPRKGSAFKARPGIAGKHATANALAAAVVGLSFKVPTREIRRALEKTRAVEGRMETLTIRGVTIINDAYNANPDSVRASLEAVRDMPCRGKKILVLADMLELGSTAEEEHTRLGETVSMMGFENLLTFGPLAAYISRGAKAVINMHYNEKNMLAEYAAELVSPGDIVLVKGSRGMQMEDIVTFLRERLRGGEEH